MSCASASTEPSAPDPAHAGTSPRLWQPHLVLYLAVLAAGLLVGLWPGAISPPEVYPHPAPLPTLLALAVAQGGYILLVLPLIRVRRGPQHKAWFADIIEACGMLLAAGPLYIPAAWLANADASDVGRTILAVAGLFPPAWLAGRLLLRPTLRPWVLLAMVGVTLGLPGAWYITLEFLPGHPAGEMQTISPLLWIATQAEPDSVSLWPRPLWAWVLWPVVGGVGLLLLALRAGTRPRSKAGEADASTPPACG